MPLLSQNPQNFTAKRVTLTVCKYLKNHLGGKRMPVWCAESDKTMYYTNVYNNFTEKCGVKRC